LVQERDGVSLAQAIAMIVNDRKLREKLSKGALETSRNLDENRWIEKIIGVMRDL
jgi:glycosyltransferase involved in cell wall biosynthesis